MSDSIVAVVDDNAAGLRAMAFLLETSGYKTVSYGSAASFLASDTTPTCLIADQNMPGMTGLQLVEALRSRTRHIVVLLVCGFVDDTITARAAALHVEKVLEKPVEPDELLALVAKYVGMSEPD